MSFSENGITVALPKGRLLLDSVDFVADMGLDTSSLREADRELLVDEPQGQGRFLLVRPSDVVTYVAEGVADLGVVGKDTLLEQSGPVFEMRDLGFGLCHLAVAAPEKLASPEKRPLDIYHSLGSPVRVATKYPRVARDHFRAMAVSVRIIPLKGSVELAPLAGLSEVVVDLVSTGKTLAANNLIELEKICDISARLIVNRVSWRVRGDIKELLANLGEGEGGV